MNQNICNICGANYEYVDGRWKCPACGAYKEEELSNEEVTLLYHAAQKLRLNAFDEAEEAYRDITVRYPQNSNGWWGLVLAKYGIKYEQDYDGKMLPTCYAASYDSLLTDKNYQTALSLANAENRAYYEAQAAKIEAIRREWVEKASKEQPVDVFLSYKDTELENGVERTDDSHEAFELYTHLKELGYHVFYSRESLKEKTGEKYEPYIFNALNTAKVMIVYGSKPEYISSTWVKNEWSRFYKRVKQGQKQPNALVVVYRGFNPASLPRPLSSVQSMDRDSMTFLRDLDAYVKRVVSASVALPHIERVEIKAKARNKAEKPKVERKAVETRQIGSTSTPTLTANAEKLLAVGYAYLNGGQFAEALNTFESFLINQSNNGRALLGKMLALSECKNIDNFSAHGVETFRDFNLLSNVLQNVEKKDGEAILRAFCEEAKRKAKEKDFVRAKEIFEQIVSYDSTAVAETRSQLFYLATIHLKENDASIQYFLETDLLYETNESEYDRKLLSVVKQARQDGLFDTAIAYSDRALEAGSVSDELRRTFLWEKLCAEMGCRADAQLPQSVADLSRFETLEDALVIKIPKPFTALMQPLLRACIDHIQQNGKKADKKVFPVFEKLLTYIPKEHDSTLLFYLEAAAIACKSAELFEQAERYYAMMLDLDKENHAIYWGLLQAKLHCVSETALIRQPVSLAELQEFNNALLCAGNNGQAMSRYIEVQAKQKVWAKRQAKRKKARKVLSVIAAATLLIALAVFAGTRYYQNENQLKFKLTENGFYTVSAGRFYSPNGELTIPETYNGISVTAIADKAFYNRDGITSVVLPYGLETIGENAFAECDNLTKIIFENRQYVLSNADVAPEMTQLKTIGERAFYHCRKLADFAIPYGVETVGAESFAGTALAGELVLPQTVTYVGKGAFAECEKLTAITVGDRNEIPSEWDADWSSGCEAPVEYKLRVVLNANGATEPLASAEIYLSFNSTYELPVPKKAGYAFAGWYIGDDALTDASGRAFSAWASAEGATLTAIYTANENTLFFNGNGADAGEMAAQKIVTDGTEPLTANAFAKDGYTFLGWATTADGTVEYADGADYGMGTADSYILYAVWELAENRIMFHGANENDVQTQVLEKNGSRNLQANAFEKAGYTFAGWATAKNGTAVYANASALPFVERLNVDLWAVWTANVNRVVFNGNGATGGSMGEQEIRTDGSAALATNGYTRTGYLFAGWAIEQNGAVQYANGVDYSMGTEPVNTLWAVWTAETYTITYDLGNGTATGNPATYTVESNAITLTNPTREGYKFIGWTGTGLTGSTLQVTIPAGVVGNRTYTAVWSMIVSFNANGGKGEMTSQEIVCKEGVLPHHSYTWAGHTFLGWSFSEDGEIAFEDDAVFLDSSDFNGTLYAVWSLYQRIDENGSVSATGEYILFGEYPQTIKADDITITEQQDSRGYYLGSDGEYYAKMTASSDSNKFFNNGAEINNGNMYFFKVEPIRWKIVSYDGKILLICDYCIDGLAFDESNSTWYWKSSSLRSYLNSSFISNAFNTEQITSIEETLIENYYFTSDYESVTRQTIDSTIDRIFLLSEVESALIKTKINYRKIPTDYALVQGVILHDASSTEDVHSWWWLRDSHRLTNRSNGDTRYEAGAVDIWGQYGYLNGFTPRLKTGVVPALYIATDIFQDNSSTVNEIETEGLQYTKYNDYATVTGYTGTDAFVIIPSSYDGVPVTEIAPEAFKGNDIIRSVQFPETVSTIGESAFEECASLTTINLPTGITVIETSLFEQCSRLVSVHIPEGVKSIKNDAFAFCSGMVELSIPSSVTSIGSRAFVGCNKLAQVTNYTSSSMVKAALPSSGGSVINIYVYREISTTGDFEYTLTFDEDGYILHRVNGKVYLLGYMGDKKNLDLTGKNIDSIARYAFYEQNQIETIVIPNSIVEIQKNTFQYCTSLKSINYQGTLEAWNEIAIAVGFDENSSNYSIICTDGVIPRYMAIGTEGLQYTKYDDHATVTGYTGTDTTVIIPSSYDGVPVTEIASKAFKNCTTITNIYVPQSVTSIGDGAFSGCSSLEEITLPFAGILVDNYRSTGYQGYYSFPYMFGTEEYTNSKLLQVAPRYFPYGVRSDMIYGGFTENYYIPIALKRVNICEPNSWLNNIQIEDVEIIWDYTV